MELIHYLEAMYDWTRGEIRNFIHQLRLEDTGEPFFFNGKYYSPSELGEIEALLGGEV